MPFCVPPHATYSQSANTGGTPSDSTSCKKALLLKVVPFDPVDRLNDSLILRSSPSETEKWENKRKGDYELKQN